MAQTTVLIGVNPSLTDSDLKKQSQFMKGENDVKLVTIMAYGDLWQFRAAKSKANSKPNKVNMPAFGRKSEVRIPKSETC